MPGTDPAEAMRVIVGELPDFLAQGARMVMRVGSRGERIWVR